MAWCQASPLSDSINSDSGLLPDNINSDSGLLPDNINGDLGLLPDNINSDSGLDLHVHYDKIGSRNQFCFEMKTNLTLRYIMNYFIHFYFMR